MHMQNTLRFDSAKKADLQYAYDEAVKDGVEQFMFDGKELLTSYARYLLMHLDTIIK